MQWEMNGSQYKAYSEFELATKRPDAALHPLVLIDLRRQVIPNALNLALALGGLAFAYVT